MIIGCRYSKTKMATLHSPEPATQHGERNFSLIVNHAKAITLNELVLVVKKRYKGGRARPELIRAALIPRPLSGVVCSMILGNVASHERMRTLVYEEGRRHGVLLSASA